MAKPSKKAISEVMRHLGRKGGQSKSEAKRAAARTNARKDKTMTPTVHEQIPTLPGHYLEYQVAAAETGLPGPSTCWVGPYQTRADARRELEANPRRMAMIMRVYPRG